MIPFKLINSVQKYSWGSTDYIPELLGVEKDEDHWAELWIGDHPGAPSSGVFANESIPLPDILKEHSSKLLGEDSSRFGNHLPFLFKVLSAESPLSIQAHPDKHQAEAGFKDENTRGIQKDAFNRNYKDDNHKPEIICALTNFKAMCGFRETAEIEANFKKLNSPVFRNSLEECFSADKSNKIKLFFSSLMQLEKSSLGSLVKSAVLWAGSNSSIEAELIKKFALIYKNDPGILAPLFLNIFVLKPGEALYQGPGELHAYVEGTGIELMSNSDNVLRGGLTPKHVDVDELLEVLNFKPSGKTVLKPVKDDIGILQYNTPSNEFLLEVIEVSETKSIYINNRKSISIILCIMGAAVLSSNDWTISLSKGESCLIPSSVDNFTLTGNAVIYSAGIPRINT
jgi:mannose-6-phosphate isomerase